VEEERKDPILVASRIAVAEWLLRVILKTDLNSKTETAAVEVRGIVAIGLLHKAFEKRDGTPPEASIDPQIRALDTLLEPAPSRIDTTPIVDIDDDVDDIDIDNMDINETSPAPEGPSPIASCPTPIQQPKRTCRMQTPQAMKNTTQKNHTPSSSSLDPNHHPMIETPQAANNTPQKNNTPSSSSPDPNDHPMITSPVAMMSMEMVAIN
jgi:hypothetical protein